MDNLKRELPSTPAKPKGILQKITSVAKTVKSILDSVPATPELQRERLDICLVNGGTYCDSCSKYKDDTEKSCQCDEPKYIVEPCPFILLDDNGWHCTECTCSIKDHKTDIRMKAVAPKIACPRKLWPQVGE